MKRLAIFASGNGTNFEAITKTVFDGCLKLEVACLITDKKCFALERAKNLGIEAHYFNPKKYSSKEEYEKDIMILLNKLNVDCIALAGYMRLIGYTLLEAYNNKIVNIHPSLLPAFKGKDAIMQAFSYGVKVMGVSVHYVNLEMDGGKIIDQEAFKLKKEDTIDSVTAHIHEIEHVLYPKSLKIWEE